MGVLYAFIHQHFQAHGYLCQKPYFKPRFPMQTFSLFHPLMYV